MSLTADVPAVATHVNVPLDKSLDRRFEFVLLFDCVNGNPNGDPDAGNSPRIDPETGHGLVTDVCLKRKVRDYVVMTMKQQSGAPIPGHRIYVQHRGVLQRLHQEAYDALGLDPKGKATKKGDEATPAEQARAWMCQTFFDIRTFGAVMTLDINCGQVRGPVQLSAFASSIDPVVPASHTIVRKAVATEREAEKQTKDGDQVTGTMGRKEMIPYGLYRAHGFINAHLAQDTGFTGADLNLLLDALVNMFEFDRSASRGEMATCALLLFEHGGGKPALGVAPARVLFDTLTVERKDKASPPRRFSDYTVSFNEKALPKDVQAHWIVKPTNLV
jgi:CRISPR-associated protein Csd2